MMSSWSQYIFLLFLPLTTQFPSYNKYSCQSPSCSSYEGFTVIHWRYGIVVRSIFSEKKTFKNHSLSSVMSIGILIYNWIFYSSCWAFMVSLIHLMSSHPVPLEVNTVEPVKLESLGSTQNVRVSRDFRVSHNSNYYYGTRCHVFFLGISSRLGLNFEGSTVPFSL